MLQCCMLEATLLLRGLTATLAGSVRKTEDPSCLLQVPTYGMLSKL